MVRGRRIWPVAFQTIDAMIKAGVIVRVACAKCHNYFDVDLIAVREVRGPHASLIDKTSQCKLTKCRGRGYFIAGATMTSPATILVNASMSLGLEGKTMGDLEPPEDPTPSVSAAVVQAYR